MAVETKNKAWLITIVILVAALSRLLPHPPNFTPIIAMGLFGAAYLRNKKIALGVVLIAMFISDIFLNNTIMRAFYPDHSGFVLFTEGMLWVYGSLAAIVIIGAIILRKISVLTVVTSAFGASVLFYFVTNFGVMLVNPVYTNDLAGLSASLIAGLPFFKNALLGNLLYAGLLFGAYELGMAWYAKRSLANL